jgi:hypothetical protein
MSRALLNPNAADRLAKLCVAEIFLGASAKSGAIVEAWSGDATIITGFTLRYGVKAETLPKALRREEPGKAAGPLGAPDLLAAQASPWGQCAAIAANRETVS